MTRLIIAGVVAIVVVGGGLVVFSLAELVLRPFPDEHDGVED